MTAYRRIIDGIADGDAIGGPVALAEIVADSLRTNNGLNTTDITSRYLEWWRGGSFDTGPTFALVFKLIDDGMEPSVAVKAAHDTLGGNSAAPHIEILLLRLARRSQLMVCRMPPVQRL